MPAIRGPFPRFWSNPIQYCRWAAHEKPAIYYSIWIGATGPILMVVGPPIRRRMGYKQPEPIPMTYPGGFCSVILLWRCGSPFQPCTQQSCVFVTKRYLYSAELRVSDTGLVIETENLTNCCPVPLGPRQIPEGYDDPN